MNNININPTSFANRTRSFVSGLKNGNALLPIILLEGAVTGGRTYHAYERGGMVEARERGTEETLGAIFWLGGVEMFNKLGDFVGKKILKLNNVDFEGSKDAVRNPMLNYMNQLPKKGIGEKINGAEIAKLVPVHSAKTLAAFKFTKIISSILLANSVIGFVVPKMNQAITNKYKKKIEDADKIVHHNKTGKPQQTSFEGGNPQMLLNLTNAFENDARCKLLSTDVGIAGGRAVNARNKHERREILFRDLSSVYFYMFCRNHINSALNVMQNGRATRLDPVSTNELSVHIQNNMDPNKKYTAEEFSKLVFGNQEAKIPKNIEESFENGIISLEKFKKLEGKNSPISEIAERMSKLQPELGGVKILTSEQVKDCYAKGLINNPEMLNTVFTKYTGGKSTNPMKFVAEKDLRNLKGEMIDYLKDIIKSAKSKGECITQNTIHKANRSNFFKNSMNFGAGLIISAYFLSTAIPKLQYWITRKQTGSDKFPGVEEYKKS